MPRIRFLLIFAVAGYGNIMAQPSDTVRMFFGELRKFDEEKDPDRKIEMYSQLEKSIHTIRALNSFYDQIDRLKASLAKTFADHYQWDDFRRTIKEIASKEVVASTCNEIAWRLQMKGEQLELAAELAKAASDYKRENWLNPTAKHDRYTQMAMEKGRKEEYAMYSNTYAMTLYRLGRYREGFEISRQGAIEIFEGREPDLNNTYALLSEHLLGGPEVSLSSTVKSDLEKLVRNGKATGAVKHVLEKIYKTERKTVNGFSEYVASLEQELETIISANLVSKETAVAAPQFQLDNLKGVTVDNSSLEGKITVVYFWATWCGPCLAAFPTMKKLVEEYEKVPQVRFLFVDTWEHGFDRKDKVIELLRKNNYPFEVLFDYDETIARDFGAESLPTKIIIDGEGKIRARIVGYDGSDETLKLQVNKMIKTLMEEGH